MTGSAELHVAVETSLPEGAAPLEIYFTDELRNRPPRSPNHERENSALEPFSDSYESLLDAIKDKASEPVHAG